MTKTAAYVHPESKKQTANRSSQVGNRQLIGPRAQESAQLITAMNNSPQVQALVQLRDDLQQVSSVQNLMRLATTLHRPEFANRAPTTAQQAPPIQALGTDAKAGATVEPSVTAPVTPVAQCGGVLGLAGIDDDVETKAQGKRFEGNLRYAVQAGIEPAIVNPVFRHVSNRKLEDELPDDDPPTIWTKLAKARDALGQAAFDGWVAKAGLSVVDLPELTMLLTDESARGAQEQAGKILQDAQLLPSFADVDYDTIIATLKGMGYKQQEKYKAVSDNNDLPYGQDVWTSDDQMVVRIKVGGRSINGRFARPPHVVKEITKKAHAYSPADIIAKLTDTNLLIPAGTKYSARDIQTWYNESAGGNLAEDAWKAPEDSGDADFIALFHRWTEGAHTAIGAVPEVPTTVTERQKQLLRSYRSAVGMIHDFDETTKKIEGIVQARGQNPAITDALKQLSVTHKARAEQALSAAEDVVYESNFKLFYSKRDQIKGKLEAWKGALETYLSSPPQKKKEFYKKLFDDVREILEKYDTSEWEKLKNPDKK